MLKHPRSIPTLSRPFHAGPTLAGVTHHPDVTLAMYQLGAVMLLMPGIAVAMNIIMGKSALNVQFLQFFFWQGQRVVAVHANVTFDDVTRDVLRLFQ